MNNNPIPNASIAWATIRSLRCRVVSSREFDPQAVGLAIDNTTHATLLDTSLPGNSNVGHIYGTTLGDADKLDLLEYLKSL